MPDPKLEEINICLRVSLRRVQILQILNESDVAKDFAIYSIFHPAVDDHATPFGRLKLAPNQQP